jgi:hypothetical protein
VPKSTVGDIGRTERRLKARVSKWLPIICQEKAYCKGC